MGALLGACQVHKNDVLALAEVAAKKLTESEPHKTSNYVLLSNISAEVGRWDEAGNMGVLIKERGVRKPPGLAGSTQRKWLSPCLFTICRTRRVSVT
jgi:hypothetical protein